MNEKSPLFALLILVALVAIKTYAHPPETPKPSNLTRYLSEQDQSDLEVDQIQDDDMYGDQAGAVTEEEMEDVLKDSGDEAQKPGMDEMCLLEEAVPEMMQRGIRRRDYSYDSSVITVDKSTIGYIKGRSKENHLVVVEADFDKRVWQKTLPFPLLKQKPQFGGVFHNQLQL
ncbi:hypothetical protein DAPPUDRAFT_255426 [Daphnia pulex]|uniref:Uncharacterized protein n=1 Tax=Daphnia pulex TaxID=6669 RepID=E9H960_DAPPU|nr:hypothetical protein DAPPUDRAFT_255426 [Daphnia pulex]|eukprot:EFX71735.1 hypothetical protein DAPPUDRAFT_255426 [Daphnia pulex]